MTTQFRTHNGTWHVASTENFANGHRVSVTRRNGSTSDVIIRALVARDPARDLPYLYSFDDARTADRNAAIAARAVAAMPEYSEAEIPNAARLFELFERAANRTPMVRGCQRVNSPAIRFALVSSALGLRLEMGSGSNAGRIVALSDGRRSNGRRSNGRRILWGTLNASGVYRARTTLSVMINAFNEVRDLLTAFAADPAGYSAAHGRAHGSCCYCGRGLTDSRSLAVGYGPICADYYGLPWGEEAIEGRHEARADYRIPTFYVEVSPVAGMTATQAREETEFAVRESERADGAGIPTLEDIAREPNGLRRMAMASQRASAGLPTVTRNARGTVIDASRVVTASYRRSGSSEPVELMRPRRTGAEARVRRASRPALVETDETQTTVVTRERRDPASRLMEDDFVWPPRQ